MYFSTIKFEFGLKYSLVKLGQSYYTQPVLTQLFVLNVTRNSIYTTFSKLISLSSLTHFLSFSKSFIHSMYSHKLLLTLFGILLLPILVFGD